MGNCFYELNDPCIVQWVLFTPDGHTRAGKMQMNLSSFISKYKCPFSSNLLLAIIKQFTIQRYHNDNLQSYTSTCQGIKDISSTFMEINEDKIVLLIFEGFQYTKVLCIRNQEIFCKYL